MSRYPSGQNVEGRLVCKCGSHDLFVELTDEDEGWIQVCCKTCFSILWANGA